MSPRAVVFHATLELDSQNLVSDAEGDPSGAVIEGDVVKSWQAASARRVNIRP